MLHFRPARMRVIVVLGCLIFLNGCHPTPRIDKSRVLATVNGERITEQDYQNYVEARDLQEAALPRNSQSRQIILNELINRVLLAQAAVKAGLTRSPIVHVDLKEDRENILARALLRQYITSHPIPLKTLQAVYRKEVLKAPHREYEARHILVATRQEALAILRQIRHGARFSRLAREHSLDAPSADRGGELGWFSASDVLPSFYHALVRLRVGEISPKPIKTRFGWHIIQLQAERPYAPPPFSAVRNRLYRSLEQERVDKMMARLRSKATIHLVAHTKPSEATN